METKFFQVRDKETNLPVMCVSISRESGKTLNDHRIISRAGYGDCRCILFICLAINQVSYDPYGWGDRAKQTAHCYIEQNWEKLTSGQVICVEHILGERNEPKEFE